LNWELLEAAHYIDASGVAVTQTFHQTLELSLDALDGEEILVVFSNLAFAAYLQN